jgi:hypothetical protein
MSLILNIIAIIAGLFVFFCGVCLVGYFMFPALYLIRWIFAKIWEHKFLAAIIILVLYWVTGGFR